MNKELNPAGRVDVLAKRVADLGVQRFIESHPIHARLKQAGVDIASIIRDSLDAALKRERITDMRSLRRALRRGSR